MKCKHELQHLVGTEKGIMCRNCGKQFPSFAAIQDDLEMDEEPKKDGKEGVEKDVTEEIGDGPKTDFKGANPEDTGDIDKDIEKPKTRAVQAKASVGKGSKASKTKAVSKK